MTFQPIPRSDDEKRREFRDAFLRLQRVNASYDQGNIFETGAIAANVYALVHDASKKQPSGLTLVARKSGMKFVDTARPLNPRNFFSEMPLTMSFHHVSGFVYLPILGNGPPFIYSQPRQSFSQWWDAAVIKAQDGRTYSRKNLVFHFRHERGGHLGASYGSQAGQSAADFAALRENIGGLIWSDGNGDYVPEFGPEYATVRQIGWEVEQSLLESCADLLQSSPSASPTGMTRIK